MKEDVFCLFPLETPCFCSRQTCGVKRAIRRALYFVSSKTVGGLVRALNFLPETGMTNSAWDPRAILA